MIVKQHWLHGEIKFNVDVKEEDDCLTCIHVQVCCKAKKDMCLNYIFGTSDSREACFGCLHRHTRKIWNEKDGFPCFKCRFHEWKVLRGKAGNTWTGRP